MFDLTTSPRRIAILALTALSLVPRRITASIVTAGPQRFPQKAQQYYTPSALSRGGGGSRFSEDSHMPCLFSEEEDDFDKYAACLAATEGLRRIRDAEMAALGDTEDRPQRVQEININYARGSGRVLRSMGMPVDKFNELGRTISKDPELRKKVRV